MQRRLQKYCHPLKSKNKSIKTFVVCQVNKKRPPIGIGGLSSIIYIQGGRELGLQAFND
jgi:hypothetical protein